MQADHQLAVSEPATKSKSNILRFIGELYRAQPHSETIAGIDNLLKSSEGWNIEGTHS